MTYFDCFNQDVKQVNSAYRICEEGFVGESGGKSHPVGSRGKAPVGHLGDKNPQKLVIFHKLYCNCNDVL